MKDGVLFVAGIIVGFFFSIAAYWLPLKQFRNECRALWNLVRVRFKRGDKVMVKAGIDLKPVESYYGLSSTLSDTEMGVWNDEGIGWHHTSGGWMRVRILHVHRLDTEKIPPIYKICHTDIVEKDSINL